MTDDEHEAHGAMLYQQATQERAEAQSERDDLLHRAWILRAEIAQIFADADHWNKTRTRFERINPDPDGQLARMASSLDRMFTSERYNQD